MAEYVLRMDYEQDYEEEFENCEICISTFILVFDFRELRNLLQNPLLIDQYNCY